MEIECKQNIHSDWLASVLHNIVGLVYGMRPTLNSCVL